MARKTIERNISYDQNRKLFYVCLNYGSGPDGRRQKRYATFPTLAQARRALSAFEGEREVHPVIPPQDMTLAQWLDLWLREIIIPNRAETTAYSYQKTVDNHLIPALGGIRLQKLKPLHIQQYYSSQLQRGLSPNTVRRHHDLLAAALRMAVQQEVLYASPTDRVEPPKTVQPQARFYSPEELKRLFAAAEGSWLELIVRLAACLGLRREEICGLRWDSVDFELQRIHIREARTTAGGTIVHKETKNRSSTRVLYMNPELAALLRREQLRQADNRRRFGDRYVESGLVAVDDRGGPYSPNAVSQGFSRLIRTHGLPKLTLHGLRHTFATVASAQGAPLFEIGKALGHATPATTGRIYTHLLDQTHAATINRVAEAVR